MSQEYHDSPFGDTFVGPADWIKKEWPKPASPAVSVEVLPANEALEVLIPCMRQSAQGTLSALHKAGYSIAKI